MRVLVKVPFALGAKVYSVGVHPLEGPLREDLDELERCGWVAIIDTAGNPVRLHTPEDGQRLTLRDNPSSPVSAGVFHGSLT